MGTLCDVGRGNVNINNGAITLYNGVQDAPSRCLRDGSHFQSLQREITLMFDTPSIPRIITSIRYEHMCVTYT